MELLYTLKRNMEDIWENLELRSATNKATWSEWDIEHLGSWARHNKEKKEKENVY